ncbi:MAG: methyltransferase [Bacteroidia bacterium]|nr:methyltransferase [Bacteroidia bacterium]
MKPFVFKQFEIAQHLCAMKVGTDAVLLGAWASVYNARTILDIGTGTGILALMLAQKNTLASITAIDIDESAVIQASHNFANSKFATQLNIQHTCLQNFVAQSTVKYDVIISNPPFFENSSRAQDAARNIARHNDSLTLAELIQSVQILLAQNGTFYIVLPATQQSTLLQLINNNKMYVQQIMYIHTKEHKAPKRILVAVGKYEKTIKEENLIIELENRHDYSPEYKALTQDYYVRF